MKIFSFLHSFRPRAGAHQNFKQLSTKNGIQIQYRTRNGAPKEKNGIQRPKSSLGDDRLFSFLRDFKIEEMESSLVVVPILWMIETVYKESRPVDFSLALHKTVHGVISQTEWKGLDAEKKGEAKTAAIVTSR
jgi:hypothetical protein